MGRRLIPFVVMLIAAFYGWQEFSHGRWAIGGTPQPMAKLVLRSNLPATVTVGAQTRGTVSSTRPITLELPQGNHLVRLSSPDAEPSELRVSLRSGETLERTVNLKRRIANNAANVRVSSVTELLEVISKAATGAIITLEAGEYALAAGLEIKKPVTLIGQGQDKTRIVSEAGKFVLRYDSWGAFGTQDISFEHRGKQPSDVVLIEKGTIEITRCRFTGAVRNDGKDVFYGDGLWVKGIVLGTIKDSLFDQNGLHGVELQENARLDFEGNTFERNGQNGVSFFDKSGGEMRGNTSRQNGLHGVSINENALVGLQNNTLEQNTEVGLRYSGSAWGTVKNNIIRNNKLSGIAINDTARPTLIGNTSSGNGSYGLYVGEDAKAIIGTGNVFKDNRKADVRDLRKPARP